MAAEKKTESTQPATVDFDFVDDGQDDYQPPRQMLNENESACEFFLKNITTTFKLKIGSSLIDGAGNGVFVLEKIPAGREIYRSAPLITCVDATNPNVCHFCLHDCSSLLLKAGKFRIYNDNVHSVMRCASCKVARFCSKECQKDAWVKFHKYECKILTEMPSLPTRSLAFYRALLQKKNGRMSTAHWQALDVMQTNFNKYVESNQMNQLSALAAEAGKRVGIATQMNTLWSLASAMMTNCVCVRPSVRKNTIGISLDLVTSLINHSCEPNVFIFFEGNQLRARSLRTIQDGEELTLCYCDPTMDVLIRQDILKTEQFFICQCKRCKNELEEHKKTLGKDPAAFENVLKLQTDIINLIQSANIAASNPGANKDFENLDKVESKLRFICSSASQWPDHVEPLPSARMALGMLRIGRGDVLDALKLLLQGCMLNRRDRAQCAAEWVNETLDLVRVLMVLGNTPPMADVFDDETLPSRDEVRQVVNGYMYELSKAAPDVFGSDAKYTMAIHNWFGDLIHGTPHAPRPGTKDFEKGFRLFQAKLLVWAGLDKDKGIKLSS